MLVEGRIMCVWVVGLVSLFLSVDWRNSTSLACESCQQRKRDTAFVSTVKVRRRRQTEILVFKRFAQVAVCAVSVEWLGGIMCV